MKFRKQTVTFSYDGPEAAPIVKLGAYGLITLCWFAVLFILHFTSGDCGVSEHDYASHQSALSAMIGLFLVAVPLEIAVISDWTDQTQLDSKSSFKGWLFWRALLKALPFLGLLIATIADKGFFEYYLLLGLILIGLQLLLIPFNPYRLQLPEGQSTYQRYSVWLFALLGLSLSYGPFNPSANATQCPYKTAAVIENMHQFKDMLETYAMDHQGEFPQTLSKLEAEAKQPGREYWRDFTNPATGKQGYKLSYQEAAELESLLQQSLMLQAKAEKTWLPGVRFGLSSSQLPDGNPALSGKVFYRYIDARHYQILGTSTRGKLILRHGRIKTLGPSRP